MMTSKMVRKFEMINAFTVQDSNIMRPSFLFKKYGFARSSTFQIEFKI